MERLRKLSEEKPILYCLLAMAAFVAVIMGVGCLLSYIDIASGTYLMKDLVELLAMLCGVFFIVAAGQKYVLQCKTKGFGTGIVAGLFFLLMSLYTLFIQGCVLMSWEELAAATDETSRGFITGMQAGGLDFTGYELQSGAHIVTFLILIVLIGLAEEFTFRGVIAERLLQHWGHDAKGVKKAVLVSGLFFGALHLFNGFSTGLTACLVQAVSTFVMGMAFTLVYYKSGNIFAVVFLHSFLDFSGLVWRAGIYAPIADTSAVSTAMQYGATNLIAVVPYLIVVLVLIRKKNIEKILMRIHPESVSQ